MDRLWYMFSPEFIVKNKTKKPFPVFTSRTINLKFVLVFFFFNDKFEELISFPSAPAPLCVLGAF